MKIVTDSLGFGEFEALAAALFGDMVKAVVDVERGVIALNAEPHADLQALLLEGGSNPAALYPELAGDDFLEFDSMINLRPSQGNRGRGVDDPATRERIRQIVGDRIPR